MTPKPDPLEPTGILDDPDHWDRLARRVATVALRASGPGGFDWMANSRIAWLATCLLIAAVLTLAVRTNGQGPMGMQWAEMLAPSDAVGQAIVVRDGPPAIGALLLGGQGERVR
jgi:hypothetical protein